ncbi:MAG: ubiquinol-cytochrome c reductase iron-sulfur subunit [Armatimonadetes bacterium]|nr:ubiquinol-cytochrome c reductase iron-sulfur subunit [Armatimonadota bacterium]
MSDPVDGGSRSRRDFLGLAGSAACAAALAASAGALARTLKPRAWPEPSSRFRLGQAAEFAVGTEQVIADRNVLVISRPEGVAAISLICTHLGCIVQRLTEEFRCPCHGSVFGAAGEVLAGPAPRALRWLAVSQGPDGGLVVNADSEVEPGTYFRA